MEDNGIPGRNSQMSVPEYIYCIKASMLLNFENLYPNNMDAAIAPRDAVASTSLVCVSVSVCVCVRERERERERGLGGREDRRTIEGFILNNYATRSLNPKLNYTKLS